STRAGPDRRSRAARGKQCDVALQREMDLANAGEPTRDQAGRVRSRASAIFSATSRARSCLVMTPPQAALALRGREVGAEARPWRRLSWRTSFSGRGGITLCGFGTADRRFRLTGSGIPVTSNFRVFSLDFRTNRGSVSTSEPGGLVVARGDEDI